MSGRAIKIFKFSRPINLSLHTPYGHLSILQKLGRQASWERSRRMCQGPKHLQNIGVVYFPTLGKRISRWTASPTGPTTMHSKLPSFELLEKTTLPTFSQRSLALPLAPGLPMRHSRPASTRCFPRPRWKRGTKQEVKRKIVSMQPSFGRAPRQPPSWKRQAMPFSCLVRQGADGLNVCA